MIDGETVCNHGRFQWGGARRFWKAMQGLAGFVLVHGGRGEGVWAVVFRHGAGVCKKKEGNLNSEISIKSSGL